MSGQRPPHSPSKAKPEATLRTPPPTPSRLTHVPRYQGARRPSVISISSSDGDDNGEDADDEGDEPPASRAPIPPPASTSPSQPSKGRGRGKAKATESDFSDSDFERLVATVILTEDDEVIENTTTHPRPSAPSAPYPTPSSSRAPAPAATSHSLYRPQTPPTSPVASSSRQHPAPPLCPQPVPVTPTRSYQVTSPAVTGAIDNWERAGHVSQGVAGARARRTDNIRTPNTPSPSKLLPKRADDVFPLINGIKKHTQEGFPSILAANRAWDLAQSVGVIRRLDAANRVSRNPLPAYSLDTARMLRSVEGSFLGVEWHVVTQGRRPGVYPCWGLAASQTRVSKAVFVKYNSKEEAVAAYQRAMREDQIKYLN
ncbi:hypothetical protein HWV62_13239 [Athelia sp. TMB]|nr:hypothetical protein HWV62_13239 [Athelia sp. TMB]